MPVLIRFKYIFLIALFAFAIAGCKQEVEEKQVYDNIIYQVDTQKIYSSSAEKVKQKSQTQYISIMYSDLYNKNIASSDLSELSELSLALGDKTMANELSLSHFLKGSAVDIPTNSEMRADVGKFVETTYLRLYQRNPTPYEKIYLVDIIENDPSIQVLDIYTAFILSDEYYYY